MPLTRNLYEMDEVVAALQLCLRNGWSRALFWLWELVVSEEEELAAATLTDCWLRWGGGHDAALLSLTDWPERCIRVSDAIKAAGSLTAERFLALTATMPVRPSVTPRPRSTTAAERRKRRSTAFVATLDPGEPISTEESANFWISFDSACRQGSRTDAFWLLQACPLSTDALWSALTFATRGPTKEAITLLHHKAKDKAGSDHLLYQAAATLVLCIPTADRQVIACKLTREKEQWSTWPCGRRSARQHAIPNEALHQGTVRGSLSQKYTNIGDVRDPVPILSEGCAYWRRVLAAAGIESDEETGAICFPDDHTLEAFHDRYFPDDIPDEWSKQDQEKSHGRGCQESAPPAPYPLSFREESVDQRAWNLGIHVRW